MLGGPPWGWTPCKLLLSLAGVGGQLAAEQGGERDLEELRAPLGSSVVQLVL